MGKSAEKKMILSTLIFREDGSLGIKMQILINIWILHMVMEYV